MMLTEMPTSGDLKSGESLFCITPNQPPPPPESQQPHQPLPLESQQPNSAYVVKITRLWKSTLPPSSTTGRIETPKARDWA